MYIYVLYNPDLEKYEATLIHGVQELKARFDLQSENTTKLKTYMNDMKNTIVTLESALDQTNTRLTELQYTQEKLYIKMLEIIGRIEVLRCKCTPLRASEIRFVVD